MRSTWPAGSSAGLRWTPVQGWKGVKRRAQRPPQLAERLLVAGHRGELLPTEGVPPSPVSFAQSYNCGQQDAVLRYEACAAPHVFSEHYTSSTVQAPPPAPGIHLTLRGKAEAAEKQSPLG